MCLFELWFCPDICPGIGLLDRMATLFLAFWGISISFPVVTALLYILTNSQEVFLFSTPSPAFVICRFFNDNLLTGVRWYLIVVLICISLISNAEPLFTCCWPSVYLLWRNVCLGFLPLFRRRQWQPTPLLWPGKSHGQRSLVGYSPWGR